MENPLADLNRYEREHKSIGCILIQTELTRVQLHDRNNLKNKEKLAIAIKEIREFADILETYTK